MHLFPEDFQREYFYAMFFLKVMIKVDIDEVTSREVGQLLPQIWMRNGGISILRLPRERPVALSVGSERKQLRTFLCQLYSLFYFLDSRNV